MIENKKTILEVNNLKKFFKNKFGIVNAVDGVSFNVAQGEIVGLIGESGSGKTTIGRSLVRLYDDFAGIVSLDGKIISGKNINKSTRKFLRKNIQMIFQDPHASLNSQKNIFAILKEPLVVNGILNDYYNDFKRDLKLIQKNFKYTFLTKYDQTRINILENDISLMKQGIKNWKTQLENHTFSIDNNVRDMFNSYYSFYEKNYQLELMSINYHSEKYDELFNFYLEKQNDYRNLQNIDLDEIELAQITQNLAKQNQLKTKILKNKINDDLAKKNNEKLKLFKNEAAQKKLDNKNLFNAFTNEQESEYKIFNTKALKSSNYKQWIYYKTQALAHKSALNLFKNNKKELSDLTLEQTKQLILDIKNYNDSLVKKIILISEKDFKTEREFANNFKNSYLFDLSEWLKISEKNLQKYNDSLQKVLQDNHQNLEANSQNLINLEQINKNIKKLENDLVLSQQTFDKQLEIFLEKFKSKESKNNARIVDLKAELQKTLDQRLEIQKIIEKKHQEFLSILQQKINNPKEFKQLDQKYTNRINQKKASLKTFAKERQLVQKAFKDIEFMFGFLNNKNEPNILLNFKTKKTLKNLILRWKIFNALEDVGLLKQFAYRYPHEFSGGQRQRVVIARALITEPKVVIADEPIASLDISIQAQIVNLLKELAFKKNLAIVFIAHDLSMVEYIANKTLIMHLGKIVEHGQSQKIYQNPLHPYTQSLFDSIPKMSNANIPFKINNFNLDYLEEQKFPNEISYHKFENNHYVLGTNKQYKNWTKK